jgi:hypothetical protein
VSQHRKPQPEFDHLASLDRTVDEIEALIKNKRKSKMVFKVAELKVVIHMNRQKHREIFELALKGYHAEMLKQLERWTDEIRRGKVHKQYVSLPIPQDHTKEYDKVLKMLEMTVDKTIEMSESDFAQYVMDDWAWKREFAATASNYTTVD